MLLLFLLMPLIQFVIALPLILLLIDKYDIVHDTVLQKHTIIDSQVNNIYSTISYCSANVNLILTILKDCPANWQTYTRQSSIHKHSQKVVYL